MRFESKDGKVEIEVKASQGAYTLVVMIDGCEEPFCGHFDKDAAVALARGYCGLD